jgi:hypothetical protein
MHINFVCYEMTRLQDPAYSFLGVSGTPSVCVLRYLFGATPSLSFFFLRQIHRFNEGVRLYDQCISMECLYGTDNDTLLLYAAGASIWSYNPTTGELTGMLILLSVISPLISFYTKQSTCPRPVVVPCRRNLHLTLSEMILKS